MKYRVMFTNLIFRKYMYIFRKRIINAHGQLIVAYGVHFMQLMIYFQIEENYF